MARPAGWPGLFWTAFKRSRNGMVLVDAERRYIEVNAAFVELLGSRRRNLIGRAVHEHVVGGPVMSSAEWRLALAEDEFSGVAVLRRDDGTTVSVQFAGNPETVTGRRLVLGVALSTAGAGRRLPTAGHPEESSLSHREREVVRLIGAGSTGPEIADELMISHNTVRTHAYNAMTKLNARSRAHLVAKALGEGHLAA
jgi:PAS domain S-box-containing protein